jgi:hypothetical protein
VLGAYWTGSFGCNLGEKPKYKENAQKEEKAQNKESTKEESARRT